MKIKAILSVIICCCLMVSCSAKPRREAYCFSIVFDKNPENSQITLYCKTADDKASDKTEEKAFILTGINFHDALKKLSHQSYNLLFNSTEAYFISENLSNSDILEISSLILNGTKFKIDNGAYIQKQSENTAELYRKAKKVCTEEGRDRKDEYLPIIKALRVVLLNTAGKEGRIYE